MQRYLSQICLPKIEENIKILFWLKGWFDIDEKKIILVMGGYKFMSMARVCNGELVIQEFKNVPLLQDLYGEHCLLS